MNIKYVPFKSVVIEFDCEEILLAIDTLQIVADLTENEEAAIQLEEIIERIHLNEPHGSTN